MRHRGTDNVQVRFGHFSESRILQSGPEDRVVPYKGEIGGWMVWCDVILYGVRWCDVVWDDVMWWDMIWGDLIWCDMKWYVSGHKIVWVDVMWCEMILYEVI